MEQAPGVKVRKFGKLRWTLRVDWPVTWWRDVLVDPESWLQDPTLFFKHSRNVTVARIPSPSPTYPNLVLRRINYGRLRQQLRDLFRSSRAQRALRRGLRLEAAGVPVSGAVAAADVRYWRWPLRGYVLSVEIVPAQTLKQVVQENGMVPRHLERGLAEILARLHRAGFTHGDLKATNILVKQGGEPWFIDFDGVRRFRDVPREWAMKDIVRFGAGIQEAGGNVSPHAAARFISKYCAERELENWHAWFKEAAATRGRKRSSRNTAPVGAVSPW